MHWKKMNILYDILYNIVRYSHGQNCYKVLKFLITDKFNQIMYIF